ncbi:hypothetical protein CSX04_06384 [Burkholderia cepacia]|nr:hypothetical protein CSX04_06384 [Burkholderia cepacia]
MPYSTLAPASKSRVGWFVMKFTVPPVVLRPYSVPCGPRSTSTRAMSNSCPCVWIGSAYATSSTLMPTVDALFDV